jgi:PTH1 family peptidyl-tRNA hydrolase
VVGLGNPGERYRRTRHNVGFMVVDALAARAGARSGAERDDAWVAETELAGQPVLLVKPLTFMNRSGIAVERVAGRAGASPQETVVVVDDWALELGRLRIRQRGSHGGHNGLRSLIETLGTDEFPRVRCGIGRGEAVADMAEFVLSPFPPEDVLVVQEMVGQACDAVACVVREGAEAAMNRFNAKRSS